MRLEFLGNLVIFFASLFAALQRNYPQIFGRIDGGLTGLSISYGLEVGIVYYILTVSPIIRSPPV